MSKPLVILATPCYGGLVTHGYMLSVVKLLGQAGDMGIEVGLSLLANDALIPRARATLVSALLDNARATHLLFVDADISFEPEQLARLLRRDCDMAAALYPVKAINWQGVAARKAGGEARAAEEAGFVYVGEFCTGAALKVEAGFATANYAGTGFLLIKRAALEKMAASYPETKFTSTHNFPALGAGSGNLYALFDCLIDPASGHYLSEDYAFCRRWRALGGEIWLDLESRLAHVGSHAFTGDTTARYAFLQAVPAPADAADSR